jgi:phage protein D
MNRDGLWQSKWRPQLGAKLHATIQPAFGTGDLVVGDMWIDEFEVGGPPSVAIIRATSAPMEETKEGQGTIRGTKRTRAWESCTFEQMATQISKDAGLHLFYEGDPVEIERTDQSDESDLTLLHRLGEDFGYVVNIADSTLIVHDLEILEDADPVAVVDVAKGDGMVTHWGVVSKTRNVYRSARVMYRNPIRKLVAQALKEHPVAKDEPTFVPLKPRGKHRRLTNEQKKKREQAREEKHETAFGKKQDAYLDSLIRQTRDEERREEREVEVDDVEFLFTPDGAPVVGSILEITKRVQDEDEAKRVAERMLRSANQDAVTLSLDLVGDADMRAGLNFVLVGAGDFSGKYHITQARHSASGSARFATSVEAHRVLLYRTSEDLDQASEDLDQTSEDLD